MGDGPRGTDDRRSAARSQRFRQPGGDRVVRLQPRRSVGRLDAGQGSPIDLTLGTSSGSFAEIKLNHVHGDAISDLSEPAFATNNYSAGSPRYFITLSDGNSLWGYPPQSGLNSSGFAWSINNGNTYMTWAGVQSAETGATVTAAYVIADADQAAGTVDRITGLTFGDLDFN